MSLAIVFATAKECKAALGPLGALPRLAPFGGSAAWRRGNKDYQLLLSGVGPLNAALSMAALLAGHPEIRGVLNLGVAGSFELGAAGLGQVACVGREIWPEFGLAGPDGVDARGIGFALHEDGEGKVWDSLELKPRQAAEELGLKLDPLWPDLSSLSVSAASGYLELAQGLRTRYAADLENMEGFALALACRRAGLPFLEVRAVSNLVGSREKKHWDLALALRELGRAAAGILA